MEHVSGTLIPNSINPTCSAVEIADPNLSPQDHSAHISFGLGAPKINVSNVILGFQIVITLEIFGIFQ